MQPAGAKYHRGRIAEAIREELIILVEGELGDPRIGLVSVSEVQMAPDGKSVRVFFRVNGDDDEAARSLEGLTAARNYIKRELTDRLRLRQSPELIFQVDRSPELQSRIDELLERVKRRRR